MTDIKYIIRSVKEFDTIDDAISRLNQLDGRRYRISYVNYEKPMRFRKWVPKFLKRFLIQ